MEKNKDKVYLPYGTHLIFDMSGCDTRELDDLEHLANVLTEAANVSGMHIISKLKTKFKPSGVSIILQLEESHMTVHTYPLFGMAMFDIFTCGDKDALAAFSLIVNKVRHEYVILNKMARGVK